MEYDFYTADVFTDRIFEGAQIAVFPNAKGLGDDAMPRIANEFNLSETVFVFPVGNAADTFPMRVFSPVREIDFAGHPIIATAFILATLGKISLSGEFTPIILEQNFGRISANISQQNGKPVLVQFCLKPEPIIDRFVPTEQEIADFLCLSNSDIETKKYRPMMVSCGYPYLVVPLSSYACVRQARFNHQVWSQTTAPATSAQEILLFANQTDNSASDFHGRLVGPNIGVHEDPPIGSAIPSFTSYLCGQDNMRPGTYTFAIDRGSEGNRRSLLRIEMDHKGKNQLTIRVGGNAVLVSHGKINVPDSFCN